VNDMMIFFHHLRTAHLASRTQVPYPTVVKYRTKERASYIEIRSLWRKYGSRDL
jgi:hypothetical protein